MFPAVMPTYARAPISFERGEGCRLFDSEGRGYLDFAAGIAVNSLGHRHPHLVEALQAQADRLWHVSNLYEIPEQTRMAERLCAASFADSVFFCNSGAEAVEGAIKIARRRHFENGAPERTRVLCMGGAFHGRTLATISAGDSEKARAGFGPLVEGFDHVPFGNLNALRAAITPETGAILLEPIQGEGGLRPAALDFLRGVRAAADEFGLVLILDEIQCGVGRTGKLFAHEWAGIAPDLMAVAKGIGGGFPMGAILAKEATARAVPAGGHGTTFGGGPLAMAVGNAVLDVLLEPGFLDRVADRGAYLWDRLVALTQRRPEVFSETRGAGLMQGLQCVGAVGPVVEALRDRGLLTVPAAGETLRLLPPLIVSEAEIDEAVDLLDAVAAEAGSAAP